MTVIFNARLVNDLEYTRRKPTKVVTKATRETVARFASRRECAKALGIAEAYVSNFIYGRTRSKLVDEKYGELEILDDPVFKAKLVSPEAPQERPAPRRSVTTYPSSSVRSGSLDKPERGLEDDDIPF